MSQPKLLDTPLYSLLHKDDIRGFNLERPKDGAIDMRGGDFRGLDLRELNMDLRACSLEGASLAHAQISGTYFPPELTADEILMSVNFGTRLRYRTK
ncbi:hypothetical protein AO262_21305 [Pseudomonas fluorescens ABAC62]|nr:hypothetical protein AO262_21305 [Pseudomonas fluorescens ABAC62]